MGVVHSSNLCTEILLNTIDRRNGRLQPRLGQPRRAHHATDGLDHALLGADGPHRHAHARQRHRHQLTIPIPEARQRQPEAPPGRPRPDGLPGRALHAGHRLCQRTRRSYLPDRSMEAISYYAILASHRAGAPSAEPTQTLSAVRNGIVASFPIDTLPISWPRSAASTVDVDRIASTLDWAKRPRAPSRPHGMRNCNTAWRSPDRDDLQHRRRQPVDRADRTRTSSSRPTSPASSPSSTTTSSQTLKERGLWDDADARRPQILRRRSRAGDRAHPGRPQGALSAPPSRSIGHWLIECASRAPELDRHGPVAQSLYGCAEREGAQRDVSPCLAQGPEDDLLSAQRWPPPRSRNRPSTSTSAACSPNG